jgi:KAP family P-loop domain
LFLVLVVVLQREWAGDAVGKLAQALGYQNVAGIAAVLVLVVVLWSNLASIAQTAGRFLNDPAGEAAKGSVNHVRSQLRELVHQATGTRPSRRRLVIFVDDLERCTPPRAVEVCEKAYQLFGHRDVAVVLIADISSLARLSQAQARQRRRADLWRAVPAEDCADPIRPAPCTPRNDALVIETNRRRSAECPHAVR